MDHSAAGDPPALFADTDDWSSTAPETAAPTPAALGSGPTRKRSPRKAAAVAGIAVLLLVVVVGAVIVIGGSAGKNARSRVETSEQSTATTTRGTTTTTVPTSVPNAPPSPASFTVHSTCHGRNCAVAVRDGPGKAAQKQVGSLPTGDVVKV